MFGSDIATGLDWRLGDLEIKVDPGIELGDKFKSDNLNSGLIGFFNG